MNVLDGWVNIRSERGWGEKKETLGNLPQMKWCQHCCRLNFSDTLLSHVLIFTVDPRVLTPRMRRFT